MRDKLEAVTNAEERDSKRVERMIGLERRGFGKILRTAGKNDARVSFELFCVRLRRQEFGKDPKLAYAPNYKMAILGTEIQNGNHISFMNCSHVIQILSTKL